MAYMSQERKAIIAAELKKVMPKDWKYSLAVKHHSSIVLTIQEAPIDLLAMYNAKCKENHDKRFSDTYKPSTYTQVNEYHLDGQFSGETLRIFERIKAALNTGNHDRSDIQTDYFDVGWYVDINLGHWDKPFRYVPKREPESDPQPGSPAYESLRAQIAVLQAKAYDRGVQ